MTNPQLIRLLQSFPEELPVFFSPDPDGRVAIQPRDAVMNLVHPAQGRVISDSEESSTVPEGYRDAVVVYPRQVRQ